MSDAAELEREAEAARARLAETADQLKARMSPGQMMDEVLNQFRDGDGNQMLANLRSQARDNPMALALVGSGLAWLMMGSGPSAPSSAPQPASRPGDRATAGTGATPYRPQAPGGFPAFGGTAETGWPGSGSSPAADAPSSAAGRVGEAVDSLRSAGSEAVGTLRSAGSEAVGSLRSAGSDAVDSLRSAGSDALDSLREHAEAVGHSVRDYGAAGEERLAQLGHGLGHGAADLGHQARRTLADVLEREPLVIGAIGLAVGAAIGALLPASALERQHLGATGEALRDKAGTLLDQGVSAARDAAAEVYETARDEADRQGLVPGDRPLAEKVEAVVRAASTAAGGIAEKHVAALDPAEDTDKEPGEDPGEEGFGEDTAPQTSRT